MTTLFPDVCKEYKLFDQYGWVNHITLLPYEELLHVPAILKLPPGTGESGKSREELVQLIDLMPTIADYLDVPLRTQGQSLRPVIEDDEAVNEVVCSDSAMTYGLGRLKSVRSKEFKYIEDGLHYDRDLIDDLKLSRTAFSFVRSAVTDSETLFELTEGEEENLRKRYPDVTNELRTKLKDWESLNRDEGEQYFSENIESTEEIQEQLRNLGYLE